MLSDKTAKKIRFVYHSLYILSGKRIPSFYRRRRRHHQVLSFPLTPLSLTICQTSVGVTMHTTVNVFDASHPQEIFIHQGYTTHPAFDERYGRHGRTASRHHFSLLTKFSPM